MTTLRIGPNINKIKICKREAFVFFSFFHLIGFLSVCMSNASIASKRLFTVSQKNVRYLILYNLKKPEPIFTIFGTNILIILASKSIYNFASNFTFTYFTSQFFRVAEKMYFHSSLLCLLLNKDDGSLIRIWTC